MGILCLMLFRLESQDLLNRGAVVCDTEVHVGRPDNVIHLLGEIAILDLLTFSALSAFLGLSIVSLHPH
jgi:hypothetical protein